MTIITKAFLSFPIYSQMEFEAKMLVVLLVVSLRKQKKGLVVENFQTSLF